MLNVNLNLINQTKIKYLLILFISVLLPSCASRGIKFRGNQFSTPETKGSMGIMAMEGSLRGAQEVILSDELTPKNTSQAINYSTGGSDKARVADFMMGVGLLPLIDFEFAVAYDAPLIGGLKIQLLGDHEDSAGPWNISLATRFGFGFLSNMVNSDPYKYNLEGTVSHFEIIFGIRLMQELIIYGGAFSRPYSVGIEYYEGALGRMTGSGEQQGVHAGFKYNLDKTYLKFNVAEVRNLYESNKQTVNNLLFGLSMGHTF